MLIRSRRSWAISACYVFFCMITVDTWGCRFLYWVFSVKCLPPYLHLATSEMWCCLEEGGLCATVLCTVVMVHKSTITSYRLVNCIWLWSCSLPSERLCVFGLYIKFFCLHLSFYLLVSWADRIVPQPGWLTIVLQCCVTVDCVIWPVKSSPKWPIMCRVGR